MSGFKSTFSIFLAALFSPCMLDVHMIEHKSSRPLTYKT